MGDLDISDLPTEIAVGSYEACFQLEAVDDEIVEAEERFTLVVEARNKYDTVDGNTTQITVFDNDGRLL